MTKTSEGQVDSNAVTQLALLFLQLKVFLKRYDWVSKATSSETDIRFGKRFQLAITKMHKCLFKIELHLRSSSAFTLKPQCAQLCDCLLAVNLTALYADLDCWEEYLGRLSEESNSVDHNDQDQVASKDRCKNYILEHKKEYHYFLMHAEHRAVLNCIFCLLHSPLLKQDLKRVYGTLKSAAHELETSLVQVVKQWQSPSVQQQLDEISFYVTGIAEALISVECSRQYLVISGMLKDFDQMANAS